MAVEIPTEAKEAIIKLFSRNQRVVDDDVHALAEKLGIDPHKFEGYIYAMLQKKFSFSERVKLNDEITALSEGPYIRWLTEAPVPPPVERFVKRHKDEFVAKHGKKRGTSLAFAIGHTQFKKGNLEQNEIVLPTNLQEYETELLNRFDDVTLSDLAFHEWTQELVDHIEEAVAVAGRMTIRKGDWVRLHSGEIAKVQKSDAAMVHVKRKDGTIKKIRVPRLSRIGKHQGKPAFGFLRPRQD